MNIKVIVENGEDGYLVARVPSLKGVFPFHDEIDKFTLIGALKDAEIEVDDFLLVVR